MILTDTRIPVGDAELAATVDLPDHARGVIVFAHASGSSRQSPRNQMVARRLGSSGYGTVLLDLLTAAEEENDQLTARHRFDIDLLTNRLVATLDWVEAQPETTRLPLGLFGASTGTAAVLAAAARRPILVQAIVSRGGRPDLAGVALVRVHAPTLLIVGGDDASVVTINEQAATTLGDVAKVAVVPGASHLFTEPGALEQVADLAAGWFERNLHSQAVPDAGDEPPSLSSAAG